MFVHACKENRRITCAENMIEIVKSFSPAFVEQIMLQNFDAFKALVPFIVIAKEYPAQLFITFMFHVLGLT